MKLALIFAAYNVFLGVVRPKIDIYYDDGIAGTILAERYLYGPTADAVLVGSSLSRVLPELPGNIYNLGIFGGSPSTGLEIVIQKHDHPKLVVVESDFPMRPSDEKVLGDVLAPEHFLVRKFLPAMRVEYRPLQMLIPNFDSKVLSGHFRRLEDNTGKFVRSLLHKSDLLLPPAAADEAQDDVPALSKPDEQPIAEEPTPELPAAIVSLQEAYAYVDKQAADRAIAALSRQVITLRRRGICVMFVRFPIHPEAAATPYMSYARTKLEEVFPPSAADWLNIADAGSYSTRDGLHLTGASGDRFAGTLTRLISSTIASQPGPAVACAQP